MRMKSILISLIFCFFQVYHLPAQTEVRGEMLDENGEPLIGATIQIQGTTTGAITDLDGKFKFTTDTEPPFLLRVNYIGYEDQLIDFSSAGQKLNLQMEPSAIMLEAFEISDFRVSEKQRQDPLTVETMDILAIKETPADNFYDGLAMLKGVDLTSASLGFKVINTRGFNSTSPVRSLQLIDGVDNQSPGLNFSLGNFLGSSDLDVMKVDIVAGASSAFYGPGAFNGVIDMTTKNPFDFQGLSFSTKIGERSMQEYAVRWAHVLKNKDGKPKFAYKLNFFYMQALDWTADNYDPIQGSAAPAGNPGGIDAINIYGDENSFDWSDPFSKLENPGLGIVHKNGCQEVDLADYNTNNLKANIALHYRITDSLEIKYAINYGTGTTVYQGDNRYSLKGIQFLQNKVEIGKKDKWFVRAYSTHEDAGESYDIVTAGVRMLEATTKTDINGNDNYFPRYKTLWRKYSRQLAKYEGYPDITDPSEAYYNNEELWAEAFDQWVVDYEDSLVSWHQQLREDLKDDSRAGDPMFEPGTPEYDSAFADITGRTFTEGGALFYDKSALYHVAGEYRFDLASFNFVVGANYRLYTPNSRGTIFQDTLTYERVQTDSGVTMVDSSYRQIRNSEYGAYLGIGRSFLKKKFETNFTIRMDKNQNFNFLFSPALSAVYTPWKNHTFRTTFSSAVRNPTMADQYLYYNVGRAILLGNLNGYDSLIKVNSFVDYLAEINQDTLEYFNTEAIKPEKVKTIEVGYRGIWFDKLYLDVSGYKSWYQDFIGYRIGIDSEFDIFGFPQSPQVYRLAANAESIVQTQGLSAGINYFYAKKHTINANYSYNQLTSGDDDEIIPAYNTPEHKYNVGISGRDIILPVLKFGQWGYSLNYRWVQGFEFEGSPQFSGVIESYGLLNAQINYSIPKWNVTIKGGASNVLNNQIYQVYGGPRIGRLSYISLIFDWNKVY